MEMINFIIWISLLILTTSTHATAVSQPCVLRDYGDENKVCVCNSTYCDTIKPVTEINEGEYVVFISSKEGLRFNKTTKRISSKGNSFSWPTSSFKSTATFNVNFTNKFQTIMGYGGAFTDSFGINIMSLTTQTQDQLLRSYFSPDGIEYNFGRLPLGGTDFSTHPYSYDDGDPDPELKNLSLSKEDFKYKIPLILRARKMSPLDIHIVAAAWSPPPWMKTNNDYSGFAFLKKEYYKTYAQYLIKSLDEYKKNGVDIWAISTGNEPSNGYLPVKRFNSLGWTPLSLADWIVNDFGPCLQNSTHNRTKMLAFDDQRLFLPWWVKLLVKSDKSVLKYIDGFAIHWYWDFIIGDSVIKDLHDTYPDKFLLYTEASIGDKPWEKKVDLGSWYRGERYLADIIQNTNAWVTGWIDWNLCLDMTGGPNWAKNYVDSPIIINSKFDEFYKQPMFYGIGHVSKFIKDGAKRIETSPTVQDNIHAMAVQNPDGRKVIVLLNENDAKKKVSINILEKGWIKEELPPRCFVTILC